MDQLKSLFETAKKVYDKGANPFNELLTVCCYAMAKLNAESNSLYRCTFESGKIYNTFVSGKNQSRPYLPSHYQSSTVIFKRNWQKLVKSINGSSHTIADNLPDNEAINAVNQLLYTAIISFSACIDLWQPSSRKIPGTFYEVLIGSFLSELLPQHERTKFIPIPGTSESISTDIVLSSKSSVNLVFPVKITTRERIVQPYAHQRILDSIFPDCYKSILICVSETQRDDKNNSVKDVCVPGTIRLYQKHLGELDGIYYIDPPSRYLEDNVTDLLPVSTLGHFLSRGVPAVL